MFTEEGAEVPAGAPLARLETDLLEAQVRQAQANLRSAQARLEAVLQGARPEEIAAARAQLEAQRARLAAMLSEEGVGVTSVAQAGLVATQAKGASDLAVAQAAVDTARANLASAESKLQQLLNPTREDITAAQAAVEAAASNVASARERVAQLRNPTQLDLAAAEAAVESAKASLLSAQAKLDELKEGPKADVVAAARAAVATAEATVRSTQATLAGMKQLFNTEKLRNLIDAYAGLVIARNKLAEEKTRGAPPKVIEENEEAVLLALRRLQAAEEDANTFKTGVSAEQIIAAQAAVDAAQGSLASAQAKLDQLLAGATTVELQAAQAAVDNARANVQAAQIKLDKLRNPTSADLAAAVAAVEQAESLQVAAENKLQTLTSPTAVDIQTARTTVDNARASLQSAEAKLVQLTTGGSAAELESARAAVAKAAGDLGAQMAAVAQAEQQLTLAQNRYTQSDIDAAIAPVALAEATLELNRIQLSRAALVAPFDAVIARKHLAKGAIVTTSTPVLSLVSKDIHLIFNVEEGSLGRLRTGLPVRFSVPSFGDKAFQGSLISIAPTADATSRTFRVRVNPNPGQEGLRPGMFANVTVAVDERGDVLLVPQEAVIKRGQETTVFVVRDGQADQRRLALGLENDRFAQVRSGLEEGEEVVVQGNRTLRPQDRVAVVR